MESICEHGEHEGETLTALQAEGATQAPVIDLDILFFSTRLLSNELFELPIIADMHLKRAV
jgi:hypothetical protein